MLAGQREPSWGTAKVLCLTGPVAVVMRFIDLVDDRPTGLTRFLARGSTVVMVGNKFQPAVMVRTAAGTGADLPDQEEGQEVGNPRGHRPEVTNLKRGETARASLHQSSPRSPTKGG